MISLLQIGIETYMMLHRRIYVINQVKISNLYPSKDFLNQ